MPPAVRCYAIGVLGVLVLLFEVVLWGVGACFLMFLCSGLFGVWLVGVLFVCAGAWVSLGSSQALRLL